MTKTILILTSTLFLSTFCLAQTDNYSLLLNKLMSEKSMAEYMQDKGVSVEELLILDNGFIPAGTNISDNNVNLLALEALETAEKPVMAFKKLKIKGKSYKVKYRFGDLKASLLFKLIDGELKRISGLYSIVEKD